MNALENLEKSIYCQIDLMTHNVGVFGGLKGWTYTQG